MRQKLTSAMSGLPVEVHDPTSDKVVLLCSGLGRVNRGYEQFADGLMHVVREKVPAIVGRGCRRQDGEVVVDGWSDEE